MRGHGRRRHHDEEEESVFVSMTDMTVSVLFIVMILLAFFASQFQDEETVPKTVYDSVASERDRLKADLAQTMSALTAAEDEVERLRLLLADLMTRVPALEKRVAEAETELEAAITERDRLRTRLAELERELAAARRPDPLESYLAASTVERRRILETLQAQIRQDFPDLLVVISQESDALRFQGEGLFAFGQQTLMSGKRAVVERLAERLDEILPCYTIGARADWRADCNPGFAIIEAVQIEGHTDDVGGDLSNLRLSAARAAETYGAMTARVPGLLDHRNFKDQPVVSVAAYGKNRPVESNASEAGRATNRRIDLRFIMVAPSRGEEIRIIRENLSSTGDGRSRGPAE
ncbi:OmpA family protein [Tistrella mobilis]|uniref:OmpA family protein n=1 Tax=Tistrella mobilis TaxID=171437 RepID=UPI003558AC15